MSETTRAREARFFFVMACAMASVIIGGFAFALAMGLSSFDRPLVFHLHAVVFISWLALYVAQTGLIHRSNLALHRRLGKASALLIPAMVGLAIWISFATLQRTGGPPFFGQAEFLVVNIFHIAAFALLAGWGLARRRQTDWHRRLIYGATATVGAPGLARLIPLPFTVPYTFAVVFGAALIFPVIGMIADKRINGKVHTAWWWTIAIPIAALAMGEALASTEMAQRWAADWVAGTQGAERPPHAFFPGGE